MLGGGDQRGRRGGLRASRDAGRHQADGGEGVRAHRAAAGPGAPDSLLVGFGDDGAAGAWLILGDNGSGLRAHWRWLLRVMVHPKHQGRGYGRALLLAADDAARSLGLEALQLTCRGGTGVDRFYASVGYQEVGRVPRSIRIAPGDDRDEIYMLKWL
ncbi:N-acetyltransferase family protein [Microbispora siamensis]